MSRLHALRSGGRAFATGSWLLAAGLLAGCAGLQPQASVDQRRAAEINAELGISYLRQNELTQAQRSLDRALQFNPNLALAHLGMASLRERQGALDSAEEHYRRALSLDRRDPYVQTNLGDLLCRQGEVREGLELLERATANPSYSARAVALLNAGKCHARAGDTERAEERMREALRIDPQFPDALYELALLTFEDGRPFQTRAFLSRLEAQGIVTPESLLLCYQSERQLGNAEDARRCADRLKRDFRDSDEAARLLREEPGRG
ncbi:tfp pilus assembly protein PilF [Thioalkalivibrio nitratireducens DSM 14787]|uniref:Tfp pilus assembly protein PilF n=1 Tax=Thioalkalivibrio nitratireducens (strain DSM 14787 / UNIQEM 213 / ALEN2) TaxID=1255043 RepID=L0DSH4_THIND|nr:type IV pilus biogenesis/stability protein PilW [Thioalkalivibrio nitratireducens]AGA32564.1 tfp pilus assembly protein PilF [Thioalkalivibrio nitratireducens DSM 14787]